MRVLKFKGPGLTKHGTTSFLPGVPLGFDCAELADYFVAVGWAEDAPDEAPVHVYAEGDVVCGSGNGVVDPETRQNGTGLLVSALVQEGAASNG